MPSAFIVIRWTRRWLYASPL